MADSAERPVPVTFLSSHAGLGGSEAYLRRVLHRLGHEWIAGVVVLQDGPLVTALAGDGFPVHVVEVGTRPVDVARAAPAIRSAVRGLPAYGRVVHANGSKAAIAASVALPRARLLWVKHDHSFDGPVARLLARRCRAVVGVSNSVLATFGGRGRTAVVHNGIDCDPADPVAARKVVEALTQRPGAHTVALVGRLDPAKGHLDLLRAVASTREGGRNVEVMLVGGDDPAHPGYRDAVVALIDELGLRESVHLLGHRRDVAALLAGCDVVAVPSHAVNAAGLGREGFGLVALEAMCAGTPVVAYADGAVSEVLGDCGVLIPPRDVEALARALARVWDDPAERSRMSTCGRERAATFSSARTVERLRAEYRRAAR